MLECIITETKDIEPVVYEFFRPMGERGASEITLRMMQFADRVSTGLVGSVGFALLIWTLLGTIKKVEDSFNFLWRVEQPRSFARRVAEYMSLLIIGPLLLVGFIGLSHAAVSGPLGTHLSGLPLAQQLNGVLIALSPYLMVTALFTVLPAGDRPVQAVVVPRPA